MNSGLRDMDLLQRIAEGDEAAFTQLYHEYSRRIYYNILALVKDINTAEELVQDIFSVVWMKRKTIRIESSFSAYLFTISRNRVYDFFRQLQRDQDLYARIKASASEEYSHIEEALLAKENADLLQRAVNSLPPQRKRAFELCKIEGCSYQEASERMGVSLSTLKDHMAHARKAIHLYVANNGEITIGIAFFHLWSHFNAFHSG